MRLTTRGRYAVTAMVDLALRQGEGPVALAEIAERQDISLPYLEQLFARLRKRGLVASCRGPGGGYRLNRAAEAVSVAEVIAAVDEPVDATRCSGRLNCHRNEPCLTHDLWQELSQEIRRFLGRISLAELARRCARPQERAPWPTAGAGGTAAVPVWQVQRRRGEGDGHHLD